jgi:RNA polymerase sigma factor (sigma-70 family)
MSVFSAGTSEGSELTSNSPRPAQDADDATDLDLVYRDARPRLIRLAVLLVDDLPTAEDVVQDVFVRLQRGTNAPVESIDRYLTTAVLNTARSLLRRRTVAARGLLRLGSRAATTHDDPGSVDIAAMSTEQSRVWHAITQLPTRQRQVVVCRFYLDLSERETARTLGVAAGTVKKSAARAMQALALTLGDHDG